jgi:hypothetical protein
MMDMKKPDFLFKLSISVLLIISILIIIHLKIQLDKQIKDSENIIEKEKVALADLFRIKSINKECFLQINNLKKELKEISNRNEELSFILKLISNKVYPVKDKIEENNVINSTIEAKVIASLPDQNLVMLSVGKEENVKVGYKFTVFRQNEYLGKVEIIEVHPNMSAGRVIEELKNSKGLKIERGDDAKIGL